MKAFHKYWVIFFCVALALFGFSAGLATATPSGNQPARVWDSGQNARGNNAAARGASSPVGDIHDSSGDVGILSNPAMTATSPPTPTPLPPRLAGGTWQDQNGNGLWDGGEPVGLPGVVVSISGPESRVTTTSSYGSFAFENLSAGTYTVVADATALIVFTVTGANPRTVYLGRT